MHDNFETRGTGSAVKFGGTEQGNVLKATHRVAPLHVMSYGKAPVRYFSALFLQIADVFGDEVFGLT